MHKVGPPHPQTPSHRSKTVPVFNEKNLRLSRPVQFKPMLFKDYLYSEVTVMADTWHYDLSKSIEFYNTEN